jgi:hypothetical protein
VLITRIVATIFRSFCDMLKKICLKKKRKRDCKNPPECIRRPCLQQGKRMYPAKTEFIRQSRIYSAAPSLIGLLIRRRIDSIWKKMVRRKHRVYLATELIWLIPRLSGDFFTTLQLFSRTNSECIRRTVRILLNRILFGAECTLFGRAGQAGKPAAKPAAKPASRQAGSQAGSQAGKPAAKPASRQPSRQAGKPAAKPASRQPSRQAGSQAGSQAGKPASRQAGSQPGP